ncbi:hypothetical protein ABVK33_25085, partial [Mycobacterium kansasii]
GEACQEFITAAGRNMQVIHEQTNAHGQTIQGVQRRTPKRPQAGLHLRSGRRAISTQSPTSCRRGSS